MPNLSNLSTPGVYIQEVSVLPPAVAGVATSIPAFIGYTEKYPDPDEGGGGPSDGMLDVTDIKPMRISNMQEYETHFGIAQPETLTVDVFEYQDADGKLTSREFPNIPKMSESERSKHIMYYALQHYFANGGGSCYIVSVGAYGSDGDGTVSADTLMKGLTALEKEDEPTLILVPEAINADNYGTISQGALDHCAKMKDRFAILDVINGSANPLNDAEDFRPNVVNNRIYGASYYPYLRTTVNYRFNTDAGGVQVKVTQVAEDGTETEQAPQDLSAYAGSSNSLKKQLEGVLSQTEMILPPSPAIAGVYVQTDSARGVWKAPANVGITAITGLKVNVNDEQHGILNKDPDAGKSINVIRNFTGRGTLVWGARTLDSNDNEWRYVNVRRFFNFVEESVKKASYRFVFEPNDANTWVNVRAMVENFLTLQWRAGALQGAKPDQAFFVRVGLGQTMTQDDILNGRLIVEVGMAVVRPAEFIVFRFMHKLPEA